MRWRRRRLRAQRIAAAKRAQLARERKRRAELAIWGGALIVATQFLRGIGLL